MKPRYKMKWDGGCGDCAFMSQQDGCTNEFTRCHVDNQDNGKMHYYIEVKQPEDKELGDD